LAVLGRLKGYNADKYAPGELGILDTTQLVRYVFVTSLRSA
jgi:hypothetical protein